MKEFRLTSTMLNWALGWARWYYGHAPLSVVDIKYVAEKTWDRYADDWRGDEIPSGFEATLREGFTVRWEAPA